MFALHTGVTEGLGGFLPLEELSVPFLSELFAFLKTPIGLVSVKTTTSLASATSDVKLSSSSVSASTNCLYLSLDVPTARLTRRAVSASRSCDLLVVLLTASAL